MASTNQENNQANDQANNQASNQANDQANNQANNQTNNQANNQAVDINMDAKIAEQTQDGTTMANIQHQDAQKETDAVIEDNPVMPSDAFEDEEHTTEAPNEAKVVEPEPPALNFGNSLLNRPAAQDFAQALAKQERLKKQYAEKLSANDTLSGTAQGQRADSPLEVMNSRDENESEAVTDPAAAAFETVRAEFDKKRRAENLTLEDEINFVRLEAKEKARLRKIEADRRFEEEPTPETDEVEGVFMPEAQDFSNLYSDREDGEEPAPKKARTRKAAAALHSDNESSPRATKARKKSTGRKTKARKVVGHDYTEEDVNEVMARAKCGKEATPLSKEKSRSIKRASKSTRGGKKNGPAITNFSSVWGTNVFEDMEQVGHLENQPTFKNTTRRPEALKQLIGGLPEKDRTIAQADKRFLQQSLREFDGVGSVMPAPDGNWSVKGMKTTLKHYQVLGVAFMRKRERGEDLPRGGILADQMGLGKTIEMLTNIVNGQPDKKSKTQATLIVASPALVAQWRQEIGKHCQTKKDNPKHGLGSVIEHRAGNRVSSDDAADILGSCSIVLTTYNEVAKSYPKAIPPPHLTTAAAKDIWWRSYYEEEKGLLHRIEFHRVVLDEAQAIKNHRGHTSMACRALSSKLSWAITGTPVSNNLKEFYPYFKFLREPHTGSYKMFCDNFASPDDQDGIIKLGVFLNKFMIRRTHADTLFNARLLDLPKPHEHTVWLEFNEVERSIYEIVKNRMIARINALSKVEVKEKQYSHVWTMILRLRQLTGHLLMVQHVLGDLLTREDFEKLNNITMRENQIGEESAMMLVHLRHVLANNANTKTINGGVADAVVTVSEAVPSGILDLDTVDGEEAQGGKFHFRKYLSSLMESDKWAEVEKRSKCASCKSDPRDPVVTSCWHIYCKACLEDRQHWAARRGQDSMSCVECGETFSNVQDVQEPDSFMDTESTAPSINESTTAPAPKRKRAGKKPAADDGEMEDWISMKGEVLPSAKTTACKAQCQNWFTEDPSCKIIIFSQFLPILRLLARLCMTEGWKFVRYHGQMSHDARQKSIDDFGDQKKGVQIMLASLKCGGLGLNLTMASRVVLYDIWWNEAVEQQAFSRCFRIGQTKETSMTRLVVKNTIDAAMMALKEKKQIEIDKLMESSKKRLDLRDLMALFGDVGETESGRMFIFAEDDDVGDDHLRHREQDDDDEMGHMGNDL